MTVMESEHPINPYDAVREYPELQPLLAIGERADTGWIFAHKRNGLGELVAVQGVRVRPARGYMDIVRVVSHRLVVVARASLVGPNAGHFIAHHAGHPADVLPLLLTLPEPEA